MERSMGRQLIDEVRGLLAGRSGAADGVLSPLVFVAVNAFFGLQAAIVAASVVAIGIVVTRLATGRPLRYAMSGVFGTAIAIALTARSGRAETYFLPGIVTGAGTTLALVVSLAVRRPLVAYASWATRGWPLGWFWHDRVRPAYTVVTWIWVGFFGARTAVQAVLYLDGNVTTLGVVRIATGWPGLLGLLIVTYVVGRKRLEALGGPSVEEFEAMSPPPWSVQPHGF
ncbi:MAG: DUF3159 domain-containing protein [Acidimicrobiia bacterium]